MSDYFPFIFQLIQKEMINDTLDILLWNIPLVLLKYNPWIFIIVGILKQELLILSVVWYIINTVQLFIYNHQE